MPQLWKKALVKPLIKSLKNGTVDKNYRPVSNLKFFSKLIECAALQQIVHHCEKHNLLPQNQSAYQKGYSCETMLIKLADNILNGMENKYISAVIACDLSVAFDTINFEVLLSTFKKYYRITGLVLEWIKSYLIDCSCSVIINNKESDPKSLTLSVPQGSCSGAYFFIMYASTLFEVVKDVQLFGFTDDHILNDTFQAGNRTSEMNTIVRLEDTLVNTKDWMDAVKLKMNPDKTEFIYFGHKQQLNKCLISSIYVIGDMIKHTECIRYLGGFLDANLSFKEHISRKCKIGSHNLYKIHSIRKYLTKKACEIVVNSLVTLQIYYTNGILLNVPDITLKPYQRLQNMSAKVILNTSKYAISTKSLITLHWLLIRARIIFKNLTLVHQCIYRNAPEHLKNLLKRKQPNRNLRSCIHNNCDLEVPFNKQKTFGDRSFSGGTPPLECTAL